MAAPTPAIVRVSPETFLNGKQRKTEHYRPAVIGGDWREAALDGRPLFTLSEAERMKRHPQIIFGLGILRAPLYRVPRTVEADNPKVGRYVNELIHNWYDGYLRPMATSMFTFGTAVGELTDRMSKGLVVLDRFDDVHPRDARPLQYDDGQMKGKWAGVKVRGATAQGYTGGSFDLEPPHAFWFPGENEYGKWWGRPRIAGAHEPFLEKMGKGGAVESRRLWFKKCAFRGGTIWHPMGQTEYATESGDTVLIDNEDLARQIVEKYENGGVLTFPNARDEKGEFLWIFEPPGSNGEVSNILEYPKNLDDEMLTGMGIPPEVARSAEVGGWSGRQMSGITFYTSEDELAQLMDACVDIQVIRPRVAVNFGIKETRRYRIKRGSLAELVGVDDKAGADALQEPDPRQAMGGGLSSPQQPQQQQQQGGWDQVQLSYAASERLLDALDRMAGDLELGWQEVREANGHIKAVGTGEHAGRTLYGKEAQAALAAQRKQPASPSPTAQKRPTPEAKPVAPQAAPKPTAPEHAPAQEKPKESAAPQKPAEPAKAAVPTAQVNPAASKNTKLPWDMSADEAKKAGVQYFKTAQGSLYAYANGQTIRVKTDHSKVGHDKGDVGIKAGSVKTVFVPTDVAGALSSAGLHGVGSKGSRLVLKDGKATLVHWNDKLNDWTASASGRNVSVSDKPTAGMAPLELWQPANDVPGHEAYANQHAGNAITDFPDFDQAHSQMQQAAQSLGKGGAASRAAGEYRNPNETGKSATPPPLPARQSSPVSTPKFSSPEVASKIEQSLKQPAASPQAIKPGEGEFAHLKNMGQGVSDSLHQSIYDDIRSGKGLHKGVGVDFAREAFKRGHAKPEDIKKAAIIGQAIEDAHKQGKKKDQFGRIIGGMSAKENESFVADLNAALNHYFPQNAKVGLSWDEQTDDLDQGDAELSFVESEHPRDAGRFASKPGSEASSEQPADDHQADVKARTLAQRIGDVPAAVREKVTTFVKGKYDKLAARYGDAGAKSILAASVLLLPVPVPGTSLLPIAMAEAILRIRRATTGAAHAT